MNTFRRALLGTLIAVCVTSVTAPLSAGTPPHTTISNTATATYQDGHGKSFSTISNTVVTTVASVSAVVVTPKETACDPATDAFAAGTEIVKIFHIANASNIADAYTITAAHVSAGSIAGIAYVQGGTTIPVTIGSTISPSVAPAGSIDVQVSIVTTGVAVGTHLIATLSARTTATGTANGLSSETGTQCAIAALGAVITGPGGVGTMVEKLVNDTNFVQVPGGSSVSYKIAFKDAGGAPVTGAVVTDELPAGILANTATLKLNGQTIAGTLSGQTLTVPVGTLAPGVLQSLTFDATVANVQSTGQSYVNVATVSGQNAASVSSTPASVRTGVSDIVYDGYAGSSAPIAGAVISVVDPSTRQPLRISSSSRSGGQGNTANPYTTGSSGQYSFNLGPSQIGTPTHPMTYDLMLTAPGYLNRTIEAVLTADPTGTLYSVTLTALDGQQLAVPSGFALTRGPVTLHDVFGLFGNLPMFAQHALTISKSVDRQVASGGDRLVWTIAFSSGTPMTVATIVDALPPGVIYAPGTSLVDNKPLEPAVAGRELTWTLRAPSNVAHTIVFASVLAPSVVEGSVITNRATVTAAFTAAPNDPVSASASADVTVTAGVFSACITIVGRVTVDPVLASEGRVGVPGIRIFLEDGESATTDRFGRYSFACTRPGMHVVRVDTTTIPPMLRAFDDRRYDSERSIRRLVHGILDAGTIQDVNIDLERKP